jgi:hypothetical protein
MPEIDGVDLAPTRGLCVLGQVLISGAETLENNKTTGQRQGREWCMFEMMANQPLGARQLRACPLKPYLVLTLVAD